MAHVLKGRGESEGGGANVNCAKNDYFMSDMEAFIIEER
jgi:hypothetical protein